MVAPASKGGAPKKGETLPPIAKPTPAEAPSTPKKSSSFRGAPANPLSNDEGRPISAPTGVTAITRPSLSTKTPSLVPSVLPIPNGVTDMLHPEDAQFRERTAAATTADVASAISTLSFMAAGALAEIHRVFNRCDTMHLDPSKLLVREIMVARERNIVVHGVGREGLMMRGFGARLVQLGLRATAWGETGCPRLGPGDLFLTSAGPGSCPSVHALMLTAKESGARVVLVTAQPDGDAARMAHGVAWLPAQTMKDEDPTAGQLPVDRPWDRYSIPGRPLEQLHAFHRSYKPLDIFGHPLPESAPGVVDAKADLAARAKAKKMADADAVAGRGPKDYSKLNKDNKDNESKDLKSKDPKSKDGKSPGNKSGKNEKKGELGVGAMPGKEKVPHYMIPLEGGHIDREVIVACKGDAEYICLLASNKILPMGSVYEGALFTLLEIVTYMLRVKLNQTVPAMCARHTNLE